MTADMQLGGFSHAKCFNCGYLGGIQNFSMEKTQEQKNEYMEFYIPVYSCPMCGERPCEALFADEVN